MKLHVLLGIIILLAATGWGGAESLWQETSQPLVTDTKAHGVGDLLTVVIIQESHSATQASHVTKKDTDASSTAGTGIFGGFTGFGVKAGRNTNGTGASEARTQFIDRLTVKIVEALPNGTFKIQGTRSIKLEKDEMLLTFHGVVRAQDIQPDNTVTSIAIADQRLETKGIGPIAEKQRPGLLSRLLSFLW